MKMNWTQKYKGFTLVEIAVVLSIVGVLVSGFLFSIGEKQKVKYQLESEETLANIKQQLLKFALINKYLPCPDTNNNGQENRTGNSCDADYGGVPFVDIGIKQDDAFDGWSNPIRYAINRNADGDPCDIEVESDSYFCNDLTINNGRPFFSLNTLPVAGDDGSGNYFVCNESASSCSGTPNNSDLLTSTASIVLVSYGEDGNDSMIDSISGPDCSGLSGASLENCDIDDYYHQKRISSAEGSEFDDLIVFITGYEIKSKVLSPVTYWKSMYLVGIPPATYQGYSLDEVDPDGLDENVYTPKVGDENDDDHDAKNQDVIIVDQNVSTAVELG